MLSYALNAVGQDISPVISMQCCVGCKCVIRGCGDACGVVDGSASCRRAMCCVTDECCVLAKERGWRV
jgi:hypothetical protein